MIRLLIADDEWVECEALEQMVRMNFPSIMLLPSVKDGISLVEAVISSHPDIAVVDINMPGLNGLDALEILREGNPGMEILMHTAYNDFDYVRRALKMGAADYLVKPVFEEDFVEVVRRVCAKIEKRDEDSSEDQDQKAALKLAAERNLMMELLLGETTTRNWESYYRAAGKMPEDDDGNYQAVIFSVELPAGNKRDTFYEMLSAECKRRGKVLSLVCRDLLYGMILGGNDGPFPEVIRRFALHHDLEYRVGFSTVKNSYEDLPAAAGEADAARQGAQLGSVGYFENARLRLRPDIFEGLAEPLARLFMEEKPQEALSLLEEALDPEGVGYWDGVFAQRMMAKIASALKMDARKTGIAWTWPTLTASLVKSSGQPALWEDTALERRIPREAFLGFLQAQMERMVQDMSRPVRPENLYVREALLFIHQNYMEDISLEQTAKQVGITQFYLSRLLKQECSQTFLELLTQKRLTRALSLLLYTTQNVQSISESVGYRPKYFYRVFRSELGITQKDLRSAMFEAEG